MRVGRPMRLPRVVLLKEALHASYPGASSRASALMSAGLDAWQRAAAGSPRFAGVAPRARLAYRGGGLQGLDGRRLPQRPKRLADRSCEEPSRGQGSALAHQAPHGEPRRAPIQLAIVEVPRVFDERPVVGWKALEIAPASVELDDLGLMATGLFAGLA